VAVLEELVRQGDLVVDRAGLERVDAHVGRLQEAREVREVHVAAEVHAVGHPVLLREGLQRLHVRVPVAAHHQRQVEVGHQPRGLDHLLDAALGRGPPGVDRQRRVGVEAAGGADVPRVRAVRVGRLGRVEHHRRFAVEPVDLLHERRERARDGDDAVGVRQVPALVAGERLALVGRLGVQARSELVRVVDELDVAALALHEGGGARAHAQRVHVVGVQQVGPELEDLRAQRQFDAGGVEVQAPPRPVAQQQRPPAALDPLEAALPGLQEAPAGLGLGGAAAQPRPPGLGGEAAQGPGRAQQAVGAAALGAGRLQLDPPGLDPEGDLEGAVGVGVGEREAQRGDALAQGRRGRQIGQRALVDLVAALAVPLLLVGGGEPDEVDVPAVLGHRLRRLLDARVAVDAVRDHHDDTTGMWLGLHA
jgi:hypothetical protein